MLTVEQAREHICASTSPLTDLGVTSVALQHAAGRLLATDIFAPLNVPPADNSAMDGYALHTDSAPRTPCVLPLSQRITAGQQPAPLQPGTAARIFTGAEIPPGANAVIMQENCVERDGSVELKEPVRRGDNIRPRGQDIASGALVLAKGRRLTAADLGLLASLGLTEVAVTRPLKVAIVNTGDELVMPGNALAPGQIYNSNIFSLSALFAGWGCDVITVNTVEDKLPAVIDTLRHAAADADLVVSSGGVSVGEEDHVKAAVEALGELELWRIAIKPGKPMAFGRVAGVRFLGLPGNPVSAFITALLFGKPLIQSLRAEPVAPLLATTATARFAIDRPRRRREYLRARLTPEGVSIHANQSSGVLTSVSWANALVVLPEDTLISEGDAVNVLLLDQLIYG